MREFPSTVASKTVSACAACAARHRPAPGVRAWKREWTQARSPATCAKCRSSLPRTRRPPPKTGLRLTQPPPSRRVVAISSKSVAQCRAMSRTLDHSSWSTVRQKSWC